MPISTRVDHYPRNVRGRDLAVGDVHGHYPRLEAALQAVSFDPAVDRLFALGDLVDRGPESHLVEEWLRRPWFKSILGNHEQAAIDYARGRMDAQSYAEWGGEWNITSLREDVDRRAGVFAQLPLLIEVETEQGLVGLAHADCVCEFWEELKGWLVEEQEDWYQPRVRGTLFSRSRFEGFTRGPVRGVRAVLVGHSTVDTAQPLWRDNVCFLDTGGGEDGEFVVLDLATLAAARSGVSGGPAVAVP